MNNKIAIILLLLGITVISATLYVISQNVTQESFNKGMDQLNAVQEHNRQCIDQCVQNGGIYETCHPRCIKE
jgi:peptidoglycan hydrolase CwlO-like protein